MNTPDLQIVAKRVVWDSLRSDPRFTTLLHKMRLKL